MTSSPSQQQILDAIRSCSAEDFVGTTTFRDLSPSERLDWLAEAAGTVREFKGRANQRTQVSQDSEHKTIETTEPQTRMQATEKIPGLSPDENDKLHRIFSQLGKIKQVVLYGSRAMGTFRPGSDVDLSLIGEDVTQQEFYSILREIDDLLLPYQFDVSLFHQIDNADLTDHIQRAGKTIYSHE